MGMHSAMTGFDNDYGIDVRRYSDASSNQSMSSSSLEAVQFPGIENKSAISDWIEMWDYVGGIRFRGFVVDKDDEKAMFVFFDQSVVGGDLKAGYFLPLHLGAVAVY